MGSAWNQWWTGRGEPGQPPPEDSETPPTPQGESEPGAGWAVEDPRSETNLGAFPPTGGTERTENDHGPDREQPCGELHDVLPEVNPAQGFGSDDNPALGHSPQLPPWMGSAAAAAPPDLAALGLQELSRQGRSGAPRRGRRLALPEPEKASPYSPQQRLMILDCWQRSGLAAGDFAPLLGLSKHTLYLWKKRFTHHGPAGLMEQPRGVREGSRLPELTKRTILLLKQTHPDWGCERISHMLLRGPALPASPKAVSHVLHDAGYELHETPTRSHREQVRHFERARPNQLWQTDLFSFVLKRQNRRVYLVAFLDDHSRFLVSFGLHASQSTALVLEVLRAGIAAYGAPEEVLTDNGAQYVTWRGESAFHKELTQRGIRQIVAAPRHPQTLGKIERFWGTLWRECLETAVFLDLADARARIGHFIDWYNFQRVHSGIDGLVPADRYFGAAPEVLRTLKERVAANALELARNGLPRPPFYMTGQLGGKNFSLHAEGERVFLTGDDGTRREVDLVPPAAAADANAAAMPQALCPDGSPAAEPLGQEEGGPP